MRVKLITLRFAPRLGGFDDRPLADFVRDKEVLAVSEHFFTVHDLPHLACLVSYREALLSPETAGADDAPRSRRKREDPTAGLDETERVLFGTLREWRNARARKDGVPAYVILTNRELVNVVRARPPTPNALAALDGIGPGKVERYGEDILGQMNGHDGGGATS
jgi:superfamily II DNA helicase RecQ